MIKNHVPWLLFIAAAIVLMAMMFEGPKQKAVSEIGYSDFVAQINAGRVHDVTISGGEVAGHFQDNRAFSTYVTSLATLLPKLEEHKVNITVRPEGEGSFWVGLLINLAPVFLFFALWVYLSRRGQGGGSGVLNTSTDAITWTLRTSGFGSNTINSVVYGDLPSQTYVAAGNVSTIAINWTLRTSNFGNTIEPWIPECYK